MEQQSDNGGTAAPAGVVILASAERAGSEDTPSIRAFPGRIADRGIPHARLTVAADGRLQGDASSLLSACTLLVDLLPDGDESKSAALLAAVRFLPASAVILSLADYRPVRARAAESSRPDRFLGLVLADGAGEDCTLAEIVAPPEATPEALAAAQRFVASLELRGLVVRDSPGFFIQRVLAAYLNEAMALLGDGVPASKVEQASLAAGMRRPPLAMLDSQSLARTDELLHEELHELEAAAGHHRHEHGHGHDHDHPHDHPHDHGHEHGHEHHHGHEAHAHAHGHSHQHEAAHGHGHDHPDTSAAAAAAATRPRAGGHAHKHAHKVKSKRMPESAVYVMEKMAHGYRRMGKAAGAGFYEYEDDGTESLWSGLKAFERRSAKVPDDDVRDRLFHIQALEAIRCREEGVIASLSEADAAAVVGWGFPGESGGPAAWIEAAGVAAFVARCRELAERYGERFEPPPGLAKVAEAGATSLGEGEALAADETD